MRSLAVGLIAFQMMLIAGCTPSLHPFYKAQDIVSEPALIGTWKETATAAPMILKFEQANGKDQAYILTVNDAWIPGPFIAHLLKIDNHLFLDLYPEESDNNSDKTGLLIPSHCVVVVDQIEPELKLRELDDNWLYNYLKQNPAALKHEFAESEWIKNFSALILTASTEELQEFVVKHLDSKDAYTQSKTFHRINGLADRK